MWRGISVSWRSSFDWRLKRKGKSYHGHHCRERRRQAPSSTVNRRIRLETKKNTNHQPRKRTEPQDANGHFVRVCVVVDASWQCQRTTNPFDGWTGRAFSAGRKFVAPSCIRKNDRNTESNILFSKHIVPTQKGSKLPPDVTCNVVCDNLSCLLRTCKDICRIHILRQSKWIFATTRIAVRCPPRRRRLWVYVSLRPNGVWIWTVMMTMAAPSKLKTHHRPES